MFFMMCANFVMDEVKRGIELPNAQSAKPMERLDKSPMFINIDSDDKIWLVGHPDPLNEAGFEAALRQEKKDRTVVQGQPPNCVIIIRADKNVTYERVFKVIASCKTIGFTDLQMRPLQRASSS